MNLAASCPLLVFSDDWGRHPSSCGHLIANLLSRREVVWVNTIGTRPPRLDLATLKRVGEKLGEWISPPHGSADAPANPKVLSPKHTQTHPTQPVRRLNRSLMLATLLPALRKLKDPPDVVTTIPLVADLVGRIPARRWTYYCVDDFGVWPGYDGATLRDMEREFTAKVDDIIVVSETLRRHIAELGRSSHLLTHGVDLDHWRKHTSDELMPELAGLEPPYIVFWGLIDRRMDLQFVEHLTARLTRGTVVFIGPRDDPDPMLAKLPRTALLPPISYDRLPWLAHATSVLIMPYIDAPVSRAMQPLKLKEYIATGKPVVSRDLPAVPDWSDCVDIAATAEEFTARVIERLENGLPDAQRSARVKIEREGWEEKATQFEDWVKGPN